MSAESPDTSASLLDRARRKDVAALEEMIKWISPFIVGWCRKAALQPSDVDDVSHDVMVRLLRGLEGFRKAEGAGKFRGWVYRITQNCLHDFRAARTRAGVTSTLTDLPAEPDPAEADELEAEARRMIYERLVASCESEIGFRAFRRTAVDGLNATEAAAELGINPDSVRQHRLRWKEKLQKLLHDQFAELLG